MGGFDDYALTGGPTVGPTGAVSWATHRPSGRAVAVTELAEEAVADEAFLGRLRSTAAALSTVDHPNVLPISDVVECRDESGSAQVWVVEDWVDGRELGEVLAVGPLTASQSVALIGGVLRGLAAVQAHGVVHGDVSPATIVVGAGGVPKLVAFGFAGLPGGAPADARTDVRAVATVLRGLLARAGSSARHAKVDATVDRAMSDDATSSPGNAADFLAALEKAARSDFGRKWESDTSLAALVAAVPAAVPTPASAAPTPASADVTQEIVVDLTEVPADADATRVHESPDPEPSAGDAELTPDPTVAEQPPTPPPEPPASDADGTSDADSEPPASDADSQPVPTSARVTVPASAALRAAASPPPVPTAVTVPDSGAAPAKWGEKAQPAPVEPAKPLVPKPPRQRAHRARRPPRREVVLRLAGAIMILLGAGIAVAVDRNAADTRGTGGGSTDAKEAPSPHDIATSEIAGTWSMQLTVVESTGFFGSRVGSSVEKTYTIRSDCSTAPCVLKLAVSGQAGEFVLHQETDGYLLSETGPNDCIDLSTGALEVANGGVASVEVHLAPSGATRTPRGDWAATDLAGTVRTTFDTTDPQCIHGSGVQRSTVAGTRR